MKKTNKTFKRFAAITSASLLAACAMAPVFTSMTSYAVADQGSIVISNSATGHTYEAYQIFDGELNGSTLSNINWGEDVNITPAALNDLASLANLAPVITYSIPDTEVDVVNAYNEWKNGKTEKDTIRDFYNDTTVEADKTKIVISAEASKIAEKIVSSDDAKAFAKVINSYLKLDSADSATAPVEGKYTIGVSEGVGTLKDGYYLVKDKDNTTFTDDTYTAYIVTVAGTPAAINPKSSKPVMEKKVAENQSGNYASSAYEQGCYTAPDEYNDVADWNIGDDVPFQLIGTMPDDIGNYNEYFYKFTDTLPEGLTFVADSITAKLVNPDSDDPDEKPDETTIQGNVETSTNGFTITFDNIKELGVVSKDTIVVVDYDATLNPKADIGLEGNINKATLTYSNNPNFEGAGENSSTSTTPEEWVIVFTYEIDVEKTFQTISGQVVEAADAIIEQVKFEIRTDKDNPNTALKFSSDANGFYKDDTSTETKLTLNDLRKIVARGLDEGTYYLVETDYPTGYNQAEPQTIIIDATTANSQAWDKTPSNALTAFKYTVGEKDIYQGKDANGNEILENDDNNGLYKDIDAIAKATVINRQGSSLPGTGGIGTTIFYLGGGAMAAIGGIYLISKRRMRKSEE